MLPISKVVSFGASITTGTAVGGKDNAWPAIVSSRMKIPCTNLADNGSANASLSRKILSTTFEPGNLVLAMWVSTVRFEFWVEDNWTHMSVNSPESKFKKEWYAGPGYWECTGVTSALKEIYLAQSYLNSINIPYVFTIDNDEVHNSCLLTQDGYASVLNKLIDWNKFVLFEGHGVLPWVQKNNLPVAPCGHPLLDTHNVIASAMIDKINILYKNAHFRPSG